MRSTSRDSARSRDTGNGGRFHSVMVALRADRDIILDRAESFASMARQCRKVPVSQSHAALSCLCAILAGCGMSQPESMSSIRVPEGFEIQVAAGPPLVERPMIVSSDHEGYLYVAESSGSNDEVQKQLEERPHSILRLEDVDGDGRYDRRTVFADGMMFPEGVLWHDGSVYVAAPPSIWKLTDTDGDGVADEREEWLEAKTLTNCANDLHGPYLGLDGWIYWTKGAFAEQTYERQGGPPFVTRAAHVFRRRATGGEVEPVLTGGMDNPVEVAFTPEGERLLTSTFLVHPQVGRRDGMVHAVYGGVYGKVHGVTDGHPMTGGYLPVMTHMGGAAPVGLARYESGAFGDDYRGRLFVTSFNLRKVTSHRLVPDGATFVTEDADFLVSDSRDFHPTDVMEDADGSLLVVDTGAWYKLCCPTAQLTKPDVLGAIYRIRKTESLPMPNPLGQEIDWTLAGPTGLVALLGDPRPAVQRRGPPPRLLRKSRSSALERALSWHPAADMRRSAVWALTRIETRLAREAVRSALSDKSASVRQAGRAFRRTCIATGWPPPPWLRSCRIRRRRSGGPQPRRSVGSATRGAVSPLLAACRPHGGHHPDALARLCADRDWRSELDGERPEFAFGPDQAGRDDRTGPDARGLAQRGQGDFPAEFLRPAACRDRRPGSQRGIPNGGAAWPDTCRTS